MTSEVRHARPPTSRSNKHCGRRSDADSQTLPKWLRIQISRRGHTCYFTSLLICWRRHRLGGHHVGRWRLLNLLAACRVYTISVCYQSLMSSCTRHERPLVSQIPSSHSFNEASKHEIGATVVPRLDPRLFFMVNSFLRIERRRRSYRGRQDASKPLTPQGCRSIAIVLHRPDTRRAIAVTPSYLR